MTRLHGYAVAAVTLVVMLLPATTYGAYYKATKPGYTVGIRVQNSRVTRSICVPRTGATRLAKAQAGAFTSVILTCGWTRAPGNSPSRYHDQHRETTQDTGVSGKVYPKAIVGSFFERVQFQGLDPPDPFRVNCWTGKSSQNPHVRFVAVKQTG